MSRLFLTGALLNGTSALTVSQTVATTGSPTAVLITGAAHTTLAASTEAPDLDVNLNRTVQFATGALTTQRAVVFRPPTYAFVASSTITNAATVAIVGAPVQGTNATITSSYALWVQGGSSIFNGAVTLLATVPALFTLTQGASSSGSPTALTITGGAHTTLASGVEASDVGFNLNRTVQFATTTPATQRAVAIRSPTYACDTAAQTITTAATVAITAAPTAGTNVTITNAYALWVQAGKVLIADTTASTTTDGALVVGNGVAATSVTMGNGAISVGGVSVLAGSVSCFGTNTLTLTQASYTAAIRTTMTVIPAAGTAATASTENPQVKFNFARTQQWATTTPTTQREFLIDKPTYSCNAASQTITSAATVAIIGAPVAGTNVTITNSYALWVQAGLASFDGGLTATTLASTVATGTSPLTVASTTLVANLNADYLSGQHGSFYQNASNLNAGLVPLAQIPTRAAGAIRSLLLMGA